MAVYLSPGVFPREIDLSVLPTAVGPLRPAFIGTANKGPVNKAVYVTTAQQALDTFGEPFAASYLMYAVLAYFEEGSACYVMRVGVESEQGQPDELASIAIDTSGARGKGWGRIPLFTGIDYGRINLREVSSDNPLAFHPASVSNIDYNDVVVSTTEGATTATLNVVGTYTGDIGDSFVMVITGAPTASDGASVEGATFQVIRNSDGEVVAEGDLDDPDFNGTSQAIALGNGLTVQVVVTAGVIDENDTFTFQVSPDNRKFAVSVEGQAATTHTMPTATYATLDDFVTAINNLLSSEDYLVVDYTLDDGITVIPQIRSTTAGERIQIVGTSAWALTVGSQLYAWDIPRSYLLGVDAGPYDITTQNSRIKLNLIGTTTTKTVEFNVPVGLDQTAVSIANSVDVAGVVAGDTLWDAFALTIPGGSVHVVVATSVAHQYDTLQLLANFSNLKTLRFAEELNVLYPYQRAYRGFRDNRLVLPTSGEVTPSTPLSCEQNPTGSDCASDTAYFQNIVGWLVAPTPGTWVEGYAATLEVSTGGTIPAGRYKLTIVNSSRVALDSVDNVSFDKRDDRYIGNLLNPGTKYGGTNGNSFAQWEERPAFLENNVSAVDFAVRFPSQFSAVSFRGMADGIPADPAFSSELDAAVIGNPAIASGLYAFQNPEAIDINLLCTPGFSTGAVIGTALQMCESRGDVLYLVDPPFGLRPQQAVDWHNGMLLSDLSAAINSSYGALYWGWIQVYDQFSGNNIWIPPSGHISAVFSRTARDAEQWLAPAGTRRGQLLTALDVEYSPTLGERDLLYGSGNAVNPIVKFPQEGIVVWGQRTLQRADSALDRVSARMLLIYIKKNLTTLLRDFVFEPNDSILWSQVTAAVDPFLADIQSRRGLLAYKVVCDASNNTPDRIDQNQLWVSIFLKPTRTVEFIVLNLAVLRTGASFSAEEVLAAGGIIQAATAS